MREFWTESVILDISQGLTDQARLILKNRKFSDLEICGQVNREEYILREPPTPKRMETQNIKNQNIIEPSTTTSMLTQEDKKNLELRKKNMGERRTTFVIYS